MWKNVTSFNVCTAVATSKEKLGFVAKNFSQTIFSDFTLIFDTFLFHQQPSFYCTFIYVFFFTGLFVVFYSGQCGGDVEKWSQFENKQRVKGERWLSEPAMVSQWYGTSIARYGFAWFCMVWYAMVCS